MTAILPGSPSERVTPDRAPTGLPASWHEAPADTPPLNRFWMGGIEGADHLNSHGVPLDMTRACGHRAHLDEDFRQLAHWGLRTVRESVGWRLCERDGQVDLTPALQIAEAAQRHGVQVLWTLMHYGTPPDISINGKAERLSPGARIRNTNNTIVFANSLIGEKLVVNYVRDGLGLVHEVWVLNPAEAAEKRAGATTERNFRFSSETEPNPNAPTRAN